MQNTNCIVIFFALDSFYKKANYLISGRRRCLHNMVLGLNGPYSAVILHCHAAEVNGRGLRGAQQKHNELTRENSSSSSSNVNALNLELFQYSSSSGLARDI